MRTTFSKRSKRDYEALCRELRNAEYGTLLDVLRGAEPFLVQFRSWDDVVAYMRGGTSRDPEKDIVLRTILRVHAKPTDPRLRTILLVIFWPGLEAINFKKRSWDKNVDSRWSNVTWAFFDVLLRIDLEKRPDRLVQKIVNDTVHYLYVECRREWSHAEHEAATAPDLLETLATPVEDSRLAMLEAQDARVQYLRDHVSARRIGETDFHLIVGTRVYGKPLGDCARELGLSRYAAEKRRQRAEAAIRGQEAPE